MIDRSAPHQPAGLSAHGRPARRSAAEQKRLDLALTELYERQIAFHQVLGYRVHSLSPEGPAIGFAMHPSFVGHYLYGRLHGGVISATLDAVGSLGLMVAIAEKHAGDDSEAVMHRFARMGTIDLRVDYLRPGMGSHFIASAQVTRLGGRVGSTQMRLVNETGELLATGAAAYVVS